MKTIKIISISNANEFNGIKVSSEELEKIIDALVLSKLPHVLSYESDDEIGTIFINKEETD